MNQSIVINKREGKDEIDEKDIIKIGRIERR